MKKNSRKLIDISRRGTMILGAYRMGTHFVQDLCDYHARQAGLLPIKHQEASHVEGNPRYVDMAQWNDYIDEMDRAVGYHLVIVNSMEHKSEMALRPDLLADWHVVRVVDYDKLRWFKSWFFFMQSPASTMQSMYPEIRRRYQSTFNAQTGTNQTYHADVDGTPAIREGNETQGHFFNAYSLQYIKSWNQAQGDYVDDGLVDTKLTTLPMPVHFGTPKHVYEDFLRTFARKIPTRDLIYQLTHGLNNHLMAHIVPADVEIAYQTLGQMANSEVQWSPNEYPEFDLEAVFEHGDLIRTILERWSAPWPGRFKEKL